MLKVTSRVVVKMNKNKLIIEPSKKKLSLNLKELLKYKDLFLLLSYRDYKVRYAQTFMGFSWAFIQPFITLLIFTLVFGKAAKVDTGSVPYPLFAICGMSAWSFFSYVLTNSGSSIIGAQQMLKKIYFPRLIIPFSKAIVGFVDFGITLVFIILLCLYYGFIPSSNLIFLPVFIIMTIISSLAAGIWMSALTVRFRDFQHVIPFMVQIGLYLTPIGYPSELIVKNMSDWMSAIYFLNPMAGVVEGFRWSILGGAPPNDMMYISFMVIIIIFISGLFYFKKVEKVMADII